MTTTVYVDDRVAWTHSFTDGAGVAFDPGDLELRVLTPDGIETVYTGTEGSQAGGKVIITNPETGSWQFTYLVEQAGWHTMVLQSAQLLQERSLRRKFKAYDPGV